MNTIMQQWVETKETLISESNRVVASLREAVKIVQEATGQKIIQPITFGEEEGTKVAISSYGNGDYVKLYAGNNAPWYTENFDKNQHWWGSLREYRALIEILRQIDTGTIISAWEKQQ